MVSQLNSSAHSAAVLVHGHLLHMDDPSLHARQTIC